MQYAIVVFRSRNETIYLANMLLNRGYRVAVINTPREVGQACGVSVQFNENLLQVIKQAISSKPFRSFYGIFRIIRQNGRTSVIKL
ncbi:MAG: DUF3343 domain-containing protein [Clostridia bacterium]|nr:DUF3343 domain-containing protein [Clostridia bacterium]MBQ8792149.1 DUF3343 domain-containing protein [Clostridia bacterium]